jgi:hypothetical protein
MFNRGKRCLACLSAWLMLAPVMADPVITSIDSGRLQSDGLVVIDGTGFGNRSRVHLLDDFEHAGAAAGSVVALDGARSGAWTRHGTNPPVYDRFAYSGNFSARMAGPDVGMRQLTHDFSQPVQSVFVSYWVAIPPGYPFPGKNDSVSGFPSNSAWKFAWLIDQDYEGNSSDVVVPSYVGQNSALIGGNDGNLSYIAQPSTWWSWGRWMRISALLRANADAPSREGRLLFEIFSREHGFYVLDVDTPVFDDDGPPAKKYQYVNFPGWLASFDLGEARPLYDDIYVASGPNAAARVEMSDNADYERSEYFAIVQVVDWSDSRIEARVAPVHRQAVQNPVFHVFDGTGRRNRLGGEPPPPQRPNPPTDLTAD